jgi:tetratricopeptide (TPR) repeat protein
MVYLCFQQPVGLVKEKPTRTRNAAMVGSAKQESSSVTVEMVSAQAKNAVGGALAAQLTAAEEALKNAASDADKLHAEKQLAKQWDDVNQPGPAAYYYRFAAQRENTFEDWFTAGNRFNEALAKTKDSVMQPAFAANAADAFQHALKIKPSSLEAKTGLGIAYVDGAASPMQGIALLLEVVKQDPKNIAANLNLGLFSMKSGQFDKAVGRFKTVIEQKPDVEPYFYLAESYKQLGLKAEAIAAYQKCKALMADPVAGKRIDEYIQELKN